MPRYFFDVHDGVEVKDDQGVDLSDAEAARRHAIELAGRYATSSAVEGMGGAVVVDVRDHTGANILTVRQVIDTTGPMSP